ncbi:MAG: TonB-dependent receptor [Bacteroidota bacterium]|nr:TonB-dependent receptor [Bacteroidota bacterium]
MFLAPISILAQHAVISGTVSEVGSGEAVIGVSVILAQDPEAKTLVRGTRTNKYGFFSLPAISKGSYVLIVRGIGYKQYSRRIDVESAEASLKLSIALQPAALASGEVTIQAERETKSVANISAVELKADMVKKLPTIGGEADVFRMLQYMPGIKSGGEFSSGLYVRGGSPDQNLTLLDGVIVYNPSHLGGFLSVFNNDAIRDVRVIKGAFPAEYGGRLSSVIDLTMKEGSKEKFGGTANISLIAARATVEGPLGDNASFMISGRRTYLDPLLALSSALTRTESSLNYYFYDLNAKLNYKLSDDDRLFVSGYFGNDVLSSAAGTPGSDAALRFGIDWGNATANIRWTRRMSDKLFVNIATIYTDYRNGINIGFGSGADELGFTTFSQIRDLTLRGDAQYFPLQGHAVKFGFDATFHRFTTLLESKNLTLQQALAALGVTNTIDALEASVYLQDEWEINDRVTTNLGLRLAYFQRGHRLLPEPRASVSYSVVSGNTESFVNDLSIKGAFAIANQFLHLVIRNDIALPTDTWFPATDNIKPANAIQYVLGAEAKLFNGEYLFSIEGYYKSMTNLYEFRDNAPFGILTPTEAVLTEGIGNAYGVELFLEKRLGNLTGWIGYTLSWTTRTFAELNDGRPFFPRFDRRHDVSIVATYKLTDTWELGAIWTFATGQAFTMPSAQYAFPTLGGIQATNPLIQSVRVHYTERNGFRLPDFHKLDINITHYFTWLNLPFNASLSIYNVYNRLNPFQWVVRYNQAPSPTPTPSPELGLARSATILVPIVQQTALFGIIPTLSIGFTF